MTTIQSLTWETGSKPCLICSLPIHPDPSGKLTSSTFYYTWELLGHFTWEKRWEIQEHQASFSVLAALLSPTVWTGASAQFLSASFSTYLEFLSVLETGLRLFSGTCSFLTLDWSLLNFSPYSLYLPSHLPPSSPTFSSQSSI